MTASFRGFLEKYNRDGVAGWAVSTDLSVLPILAVYVNDSLVGECIPCFPRTDIGNEQGGFIFTFPQGLFIDGNRDAKTARFDVRIKQTGMSITNSPVVSSIDSSDRNKVLLGKDGVLFLKEDSNNVLAQISGQLFAESSKEEWRKILKNRRIEAAARDMPMVNLVVPDKERVYSDKLPDGLSVSDFSTFDQWKHIYELARNGVNGWALCYPLDTLKAGRNTCETYSKGDTHWNYYGAYLAYHDLISSMPNAAKCVPLEIPLHEFTMNYQNADLLGKLGGACVEKQVVVNYTKIKTEQTANNGKWLVGRCVRYKSTLVGCAKKKVLVFHDSFGPFLERYLASSFAETQFVWSPDVLWDDVDAYKPDIVVIEQVERFLVRAPNS